MISVRHKSWTELPRHGHFPSAGVNLLFTAAALLSTWMPTSRNAPGNVHSPKQPWLRRWRRLLRLLSVVLLAAGSLAAHAETLPPSEDARFPATPMHEEVLTLPGDPARPAALQATLYLPPGPGPFPLAVMNHGATEASDSNRGDRYRFTTSAYYFLSRGYAVLLPMARGFAGSEGRIAHEGCDLAQVARENAADVANAMKAILAARPELDGSRIVVAGQSFGGWTALGLGTEPPAGVRALIAFNPAIRSSDCHDQDRGMIESAASLAARTRLPSLWFFGENDTVMPTATWRAMFARYKAAGGRAELVDVGTFGADSHQMLSSPSSLPIWSPRADAFLARAGLPSSIVHPEFLPHPVPPPTHWAALDDVGAVPGLSDGGRALYRRFLDRPFPRAFALAPGRAASMSSSGYDPAGFALRACDRQAPDCRLYAVDDQVVWSAPAQDAAPVQQAVQQAVRQVSRVVRAGVSTSLGAFYDVKPDCSARGLPDVKVVEAPQHGAAQVAERDERPNFPAGSPFASCNATPVSATGVTYMPALGYTGPDALTLDETDLAGHHHAIHLSLSVQ